MFEFSKEWFTSFIKIDFSDLKGLMKGGIDMKSSHKVERFDYSKYESNDAWGYETLKELEFWGFHKKNGRIHIDTKRYKKACEKVGITEFLPSGLFQERNTVYFIPAKIKRSDYKVNIFRDFLNALKKDWVEEYKPILNKIRTPNEVAEQSRLNSLCMTSDSDDYDEIEIESRMAGFRREKTYFRILQSLYCQFIMKIASEVDRLTLFVMTDCGYKGTDYSFESFCKFTDGLIKNINSKKIKDLSKYNAYNMLHKINNFLKHNSIESYKTLKKLYPNNVASIENGTAKEEYENGMFAGEWIIVKDNYIDELIDKLIKFFEDYCKTYLNEDLDESRWNYDEFFMNAYYKMRNPIEYFGL